MSAKCSHILGVFSGLLALGLVLALISCAKDENERLIKAIKEGRLEEVMRLLNSSADVSAEPKYGATALVIAPNTGTSRSWNSSKPTERRNEVCNKYLAAFAGIFTMFKPGIAIIPSGLLIVVVVFGSVV
jgi:hypothetical protein